MKPTRPRAFTLIELLAAVAISTIIAGVAVAVTARVMDAWSRRRSVSAAMIEAQQIFQHLERDLASLQSRPDAQCGFAVDVLNASAALANHGWLMIPGPMKPPDPISLKLLPESVPPDVPRLTQARFGLSGAWLRFVAENVESGGTEPCAISYQLARRPVSGNPTISNPAPVRYALYRSAISPAETFAAGFDVTAAAYASATNNPSSAASGVYRQPRNLTNPSHANLLAPNVVDVGCWLYRRQSDGTWSRIFPAAPADMSHHATGDATADDACLPDAIDVMVRILDADSAVRLEAMEKGNIVRPSTYATDGDWWWAFVEEHSQVFVRRFEVLRHAIPN